MVRIQQCATWQVESRNHIAGISPVMMNGLPFSRLVKLLLNNESIAIETRLNRESGT